MLLKRFAVTLLLLLFAMAVTAVTAVSSGVTSVRAGDGFPICCWPPDGK